MAATPARIGFIMSEFRRAVSTTQTAKDRFGSAARESADPVQTYFDNVADAQAIADERQALLSAERRRFRVTVQGVEDVADLDISGRIPVSYYVDTDRAADRLMLVSEIVMDFGRQTSTVTIWG